MEQNNLKHEYLAYIGLYEMDGRAIGQDKSYDELTDDEIERADYMYCRDVLLTNKEVVIGRENIKKTMTEYSNYILRRLEGAYSYKNLLELKEELELLMDEQKDDLEIMDGLWAKSYSFDEKKKSKQLKRSKR